MSPTLGQKSARIALVGNPNAGKTSLFNALTGARQKIGNYPGVTVQKVSGSYCEGGRVIEVVDLPGLYSLAAVSEDETVALGELTTDHPEESPDLFVAVIDASNLERNLFLFSQVAELGRPILVALTMTDMVDEFRTAELAARLGVQVVPVVAHKGVGLAELKAAIEENLKEPVVPDLELGYPEAVRQAVRRLSESGAPGTVLDLRHALLTNDAAGAQEWPEASRVVLQEQRKVLLGENLQGRQLDSRTRYAWASQVRRQVTSGPHQSHRLSDRIDAVLTHRVFGLVIFAALMYGVFQSIYTFAAPLMDLVERLTGGLQDAVGPMLAGTPMLRDLVTDGVIAGVGGVLVFLPQILILFFWIAVLEGTGYLARAAFLMDRLLGWCGLSGRAFIPLLSSYACAIPGIMAARVMPDSRSRLVTVLVAPLMSCSARLPVYVLLIGLFVEPVYGPAWAGFALFFMHLLGLFVAIPTAWILNRRLLRGPRIPFLMELPRYQWPKMRDIGLTMWTKALMFLKTAGTVILAMSVLIWAALYFPRPAAGAGEVSPTVQLEQSYLGQFGKTVAPAFEPAGFDWRLTTSVLAAFPAREVVVSAMSVIFGMGEGEDSPELRVALKNATWPDGRPLMSLWNAMSLMVFCALCCQCLSTVATIKQETGSWKIAWAAFAAMTVLAYGLAVAVYQLGRVLGQV